MSIRSSFLLVAVLLTSCSTLKNQVVDSFKDESILLEKKCFENEGQEIAATGFNVIDAMYFLSSDSIALFTDVPFEEDNVEILISGCENTSEVQDSFFNYLFKRFEFEEVYSNKLLQFEVSDSLKYQEILGKGKRPPRCDDINCSVDFGSPLEAYRTVETFYDTKEGRERRTCHGQNTTPIEIVSISSNIARSIYRKPSLTENNLSENDIISFTFDYTLSEYKDIASLKDYLLSNFGIGLTIGEAAPVKAYQRYSSSHE